MDINLKTLIGKLNDSSRAAATRAAAICVGQGHYEVDIEHLFLALLEQPDCDFACIARQCGISLTGLETDLRKRDRALRRRQRAHAGVFAPPADAVRTRLADRLAGRRRAAPDPQRPPAAGAADRARPGATGAARLEAVRPGSDRPPQARLRQAHARLGRSAAAGRQRLRAPAIRSGTGSAPAARHPGARPVHHRPDRSARATARSIRCSAAMPKSAR